MTATKRTTDEVAALLESAEEAVRALEQLEERRPFAEHVGRAEEALRALHNHVRPKVFPSIFEPADSSALLDFAGYVQDRIRRLTAAGDLAGAHADSYPALRSVIRGPRGQLLLARISEASASTRGLTEAESIARDWAEFEATVSCELAARDELQPYAGILATVLPSLRARFGAAKSRHEAAAAAALEELSAREREEERVLADGRAARRRELAERLRRRPQSEIFPIPIRQFGDRDELPAIVLASWVEQGAFDEDFLGQLEQQLDLRERGSVQVGG
ncbi:MAG TPA: hypothetical protein VNN19_10395 [bacterium]|nr:hypothetical protein [bacterium]